MVAVGQGGAVGWGWAAVGTGCVRAEAWDAARSRERKRRS